MSVGRRKVLHVLNGFAVGGVENLAYQLIKNSPAVVDSVVLNINKNEAAQREKFTTLPVHLVELQAADGWQLLLSYVSLIDQINPCAVVIYPFCRPMLWVALAARICGVERVVISVGNLAPKVGRGRDGYRRMFRWLAAMRVTAIPCSASVRSSVEDMTHPGLLDAPIPNGCDCLAIRERVIRRERKSTSPRIIMVARFDAMKDQETLIRGFAVSRLWVEGWQLVLAGDGPNRGYCADLAFSLGVGASVEFLGSRDDIGDCLADSDIFALCTTETEGFGIAIVEAMAAGLPVVTTDVPACREVLLDGTAGVLVKGRDPDAWAAILRRLADDPEERKKWRERASDAAAVYDIRATAPAWYAAVLGDRPFVGVES